MDLKLDSDNDVLVENGDLVLLTGVEAVGQHLRNRLNTFFQEWFLDKREGVPYFEHIFKKKINPLVVDGIFKREIINTPGILELKSFNLDIDGTLRVLTLSFTASSTDGDINFSEVVPSA